MLRSWLLVSALGLTASAAQAQEAKGPSDEAVRHFESKVRPVLVEQCYRCHGPEKQKGHLRVDGRSKMLAGGDLGPALQFDRPEESLLLKAIRHEGELKMPPTKKLTREQIDDLTRWVKMGAPWPGDAKDPPVAVAKKGDKEITDKDREHWAFKKVARPPVPAVKQADWVKNPIDAFVLSKLEAKGLAPNGPATSGQWLRRATFNVTGLPPTPEEVEAFAKADSPQTRRAIIEKLVTSPRMGEKWARHWLDVVRFAETNSYERDNPKPHTWRYRDYVIRAMNADKPFDAFLREQLAGDEMPNPGPDQWIATGFYRLGIWDDEPSDRLQARYDGLDDIVTTVSQGILGLTLDCARCHEHKIDPFQHRDYYRFLAFFHNINHFRNGGPTDEMPIFANEAEKEAAQRELKNLVARRDQVQLQLAAIEKEFAAEAKKSGSGAAPEVASLVDLKYRFYRNTWDKLPDFEEHKFEDEGKLPAGFVDLAPRTRNEAFGFVYEGSLVVPAEGVYTFHLDSDDGSRLLIGGKELIRYDGIHGVGMEKRGELALKAGRHPFRLEYFQRQSGYGLYAAWSGPGFSRKMLTVAPSAKNASADFNAFFKDQAPQVLGKKRFAEYKKLQKELETLKNPEVALASAKALIVSEAGPNAPETHVLIRGNPGAKGPKTEPGFPEVLGFPDPNFAPLKAGKSSGRRTVLADWVTSRDNPLTARVIVNRLWQHHFGRGIVRSPNNFGMQGDRPTHPELLDWLAAELMENGWSLRHLHRLILASNVYAMASTGRPEALKADPTNDLLWRFDMRRLHAEEIRDAILATSGNLNLAMHGPGIFPEIPREVLAGQSVPGRGWKTSPPEEQTRRSVYVHVKRSLLLPILESFDAAETDRSAPTRFASTQPTQALLLVNSVFANRQAEIFAERLRREVGDDDVNAQVRRGLALATSREPTVAEVRRGTDLVAALRGDGANPREALRYFCLMAINLNEFVYLD